VQNEVKILLFFRNESDFFGKNQLQDALQFELGNQLRGKLINRIMSKCVDKLVVSTGIVVNFDHNRDFKTPGLRFGCKVLPLPRLIWKFPLHIKGIKLIVTFEFQPLIIGQFWPKKHIFALQWRKIFYYQVLSYS